MVASIETRRYTPSKTASRQRLYCVVTDPIGFEAGDANLYRYVGNSSTNDTDPSGLSAKGKAIGWVVKRVGGQLVKIAAIYTEKDAAAMFLGKCAKYNLDLLMREGRQHAHKVARIIENRLGKSTTGEILEGGSHLGHPIKNKLFQAIGTGTRHIQFDKIGGRHIFYGTLAATLLAMNPDSTEASDIDITEVYGDAYPGKSVFNGLTATYWCGEESLVSYVDWLNPLELAAIGADVGRSMDRERWKELIGYTITIKDGNGSPLISIAIGPDGEPISQTPWNNGVPGVPTPLQ
jgi:hypothetical protein